MAYTSVSYGSRGNDVTELQKKLNENGYNLKEDGIFGNATRTAVQDYQRKNSLKVDGIAGNETWGSLTKSSTTTTAPAVQAQQTPQYSASYDAQLDSLFQKIMNREKFSYNVNDDAIYQQYRDLYMQQGQQAMQDTMGQAAGLTGGYGSTYSQNAGQQAYNAYLQQLNGVVPELAGAAADRYAQEGDALYREYAMLGDLRDTEYGRYQDQMDRYWQEKEFAYQQERDKVADEQWERQFAAAQAARYRSGSGNPLSGDGQGERKMTADSTPDKIWNTPSAQELYNPNATYSEVARSIKAALQSGQTDFADRLAEAYYNNRPEWREKMIAEGLAEALQ